MVKVKTAKLVERAWIFDVDGVITHPSEKKVTEPELFLNLRKILAKGEIVALNTGRSADFIIKQVFGKLENQVIDKKLLENLYAVGEKGAVMIEYGKNGERKEYIDETISVPVELQEAAKKLAEVKYKDCAFYDFTKKTMVSIEMRDGFKVPDFAKRQRNLNIDLMRLLKESNLRDDFEIEPSRIATDLQKKGLGKALGAKRILTWLEKLGIRPKLFLTFGDGETDLAMADELYKRNFAVQFIYVGEKERLKDRIFPFPVTFTQELCEKGTVEYLNSHNR